MRELLQRTALWLAAIIVVSGGFWALGSATDALLALAIALGGWLKLSISGRLKLAFFI